MHSSSSLYYELGMYIINCCGKVSVLLVNLIVQSENGYARSKNSEVGMSWYSCDVGELSNNTCVWYSASELRCPMLTYEQPSA